MTTWEVTSVTDAQTGRMFEQFGERYGLTRREREVFRLLVLFGFRNEEMGSALHIATKTLKNHLACMMGKTRTHSSRELQALFLRFLLQAGKPPYTA